MGLINENESPAADAPADGGNPVQALADAAVKQVPEKYKDVFARVLAAGRKFMYGSDKTHALVEQELAKSEDPVAAAGAGVTKLMGLLMKESRNTIPKEVFAPASLALMAEALDYVGQSRKQEITKEDVARAGRSYGDSMLKAAGLDDRGFENLANKTNELMQNPQAAALIQRQMQGA